MQISAVAYPFKLVHQSVIVPSRFHTFRNSFHFVHRAKHVAVVAFGGGKAEIVQRVLEVQSLPGALPAQLVRPDHGQLTWFLDIESAQNLKVGQWHSAKEFPRSNGQQGQDVRVGSA